MHDSASHTFPMTKTTPQDFLPLIRGKNRKSIVVVGDNVSRSIRQMPENYLLAYNCHTELCDHPWVCRPDLAADKRLIFLVFELLLDYDLLYDRTGFKIKDKIDELKIIAQTYFHGEE